MGTPNVDKRRLIRELTEILSKPIYSLWLMKANEDAAYRREFENKVDRLRGKPGAGKYKIKGPKEFAVEAVDKAFGKRDRPNLLDPVVVKELKTDRDTLLLYRMFDGISLKTAVTLGRWWCNRSLLEDICAATSKLSGTARENQILEYMRTAMFVDPSWNGCTDIAVMKIPAGASLPAIIGRGNWKALKSPAIRTQRDVIDKLRIMPIPGATQVFVPLVDGMWVDKLVRSTSGWPLA